MLEEYIDGVEMVGEGEIRETVAQIIGKMRTEGLPVTKGTVLKALQSAGGAFGGRNVEMTKVAQTVEGML